MVCPLPPPSGWNPMHQQPPHTPLFASTSAAKSSQVSEVSIRVVSAMSVSVMIGRHALNSQAAVPA